MRANDLFRRPANATQDCAGKAFWPHPDEGGSAAPPGLLNAGLVAIELTMLEILPLFDREF